MTVSDYVYFILFFAFAVEILKLIDVSLLMFLKPYNFTQVIK